MRIAPVYLVAPEPDPPPRTRRAFLYGLLVGGAAAGLGALALGRGGSEGEVAAPAEEADERLRWALELQEGGLGALVAANTDFLLVFTDRLDARTRLERGIERLTMAVLEDDPLIVEQRTLLAAKLWQAIQALPESSQLRRWLPALDRLRR